MNQSQLIICQYSETFFNLQISCLGSLIRGTDLNMTWGQVNVTWLLLIPRFISLIKDFYLICDNQ